MKNLKFDIRISYYTAFLAIVTSLLTPSGALLAAETPSPLGFAIGKATRAQVTAGLKGRTKLNAGGTNKYSGGPMLTAPGTGLGIENLQEVTFIFDGKDVLAAVLMSLAKGALDSNFDRVYSHLSSKYTVVSKELPFVGNKHVRFRTAGTVIDLDSPHMSFTMTVAYMTDDFDRQYKAVRQQEATEKKGKERNQF